MQRFFVALVASYFIICCVAFGVGVWVHDTESFALHFGLGLFATLLAAFVHCVVITYFVITGKLIKQAVLLGHLEGRYIRESQALKGRITWMACAAVVLTLAAAVTGTWADTDPGQLEARATLHMLAEILALAANLTVFVFAYASIRENALRVDEVFECLDQRPHAKLPI